MCSQTGRDRQETTNFEKFPVFFPKGIDKGGRIWYSKRAVREVSGVLEGRGKRFKRIWKKHLTNGSGCGKIIKLSRGRGWKRVKGWKKLWKSWKKHLTKESWCDKITKLSEAESGASKVLKKLWKKYLTSSKKCGKIKNVPPPRRRRVPCKLNNVTNEKHQSSMSEKDMDKEAARRG